MLSQAIFFPQRMSQRLFGLCRSIRLKTIQEWSLLCLNLKCFLIGSQWLYLWCCLRHHCLFLVRFSQIIELRCFSLMMRQSEYWKMNCVSNFLKMMFWLFFFQVRTCILIHLSKALKKLLINWKRILWLSELFPWPQWITLRELKMVLWWNFCLNRMRLRRLIQHRESSEFWKIVLLRIVLCHRMVIIWAWLFVLFLWKIVLIVLQL